MMLDSFWLVIIFLVFQVGLILGSIYFGFWMGKQAKGEAIEKSKPFNPGSGEIIEKDPYAEAMRSPEENKRIQTMKGEE